MSLETRSKIAIVTGAASGIGYATAKLLSRTHAAVYAWGLDEHVDFRTGPQQSEIDYMRVDVSKEGQVRSAMEQIGKRHGRLDTLVSNAGVNCFGSLDTLTEEDWDHCFAVNLKAAYLVTKQAIPLMKAAGEGAIVYVSSNGGILPRVEDPAYCIAKAALNALAKNVALSYAEHRIRANAVCPGPVMGTRLTENNLGQGSDRDQRAKSIMNLTPLARAYQCMISVEEVAESIAYLCSEVSRFVTGSILAIDGGRSLGVPPHLRADAFIS